MTAGSDSWTVAELRRLLHTHRIDTDLVAPALCIHGKPESGATSSTMSATVRSDCADRAALVLNILVRLEVRCGGDTVAIGMALDRPTEALSGGSIAEALRAGPDVPGLRLLREIAGTITVPRVRMWRAADRYS